MISGAVTPFREAIVQLEVLGASGQPVDFAAVIDTGFTDFLTLPLSFIQSLRLPKAGSTRVVLADASEVDLDVYLADVVWDNQTITISAMSAEGDPLVGMSLLSGFNLSIDVVDGGAVTATKLP
jgi:clan AA aspartic protease